MSDDSKKPERKTPQRHTAGWADIRSMIGMLIGIYGVILTLTGLFGTTAADKAKEGGVNADLWVGIVLILVGIGFLAWARLRPTVVDEAKIDKPDEMRASH